MKIAKKVLVVLLAVAMIAAMSAMAFAADEGKMTFEVSEVKDGKFTVSLYADDAVGMKAAGVTFNFDANIIAPIEKGAVKNGADSKATVNGESANTFSSNNNTNVAGQIKYAFNFLETLWSAEEYDAEGITVNDKHFEVAVITFEVKDANAEKATITMTLDNFDKSGLPMVLGTPSADVVINAKAEEPTEAPTEKPTEAPTEEEPSSEKVTAEAPSGDAEPKPDDGQGNKGTGDNMALAAAAGVVVLAGAAFVITKKRK